MKVPVSRRRPELRIPNPETRPALDSLDSPLQFSTKIRNILIPGVVGSINSVSVDILLKRLQSLSCHSPP